MWATPEREQPYGLGHLRFCVKVPTRGVKGFWQEDKMCYSSLTQAASGMESHLSDSREVWDRDPRRGPWKNPWHNPMRRVLLWPTRDAFCGQRPSSNPSCLIPYSSPAHGFDLKYQRVRVGWGRTRAGGVNYKVAFLLCHESC